MLKFVKDKSNGGYFTCGKEIKEFKNVTIGSLARISFLLAFKFRKSDDDLMIWGKINNIRNTKAAHGGGQYVSIREIKEILNFVELFLTHP